MTHSPSLRICQGHGGQGKGLFATQDFEPGALILDEAPVLKALSGPPLLDLLSLSYGWQKLSVDQRLKVLGLSTGPVQAASEHLLRWLKCLSVYAFLMAALTW